MADRIRGNARDLPNHSASIPGDTRVGVTPPRVGESGFPDLKELRDILKEVDIAPLERALDKPEGSVGRRPYPRGPIIRAFLSMPFMGIADLSSLRKKLMNDPALRYSCGFITRVPSRWTFSRVYGRLKEMPELTDGCLEAGVARLREYLPDLGKEVAVDSTLVKTNSNPNRTPVSDPEASPGIKLQASAPGDKLQRFGFKYHIVDDVNAGVPLKVIVTTGSAHDTNYLIPLIEGLGYKPKVVIADRGYDSVKNNLWLHRQGIAPVIHKRNPPKGYHTRGRMCYSPRGTPLCECGHERPFIGIDLNTGERIYGPVEGCNRGGKLEGLSMCDVEVRVNPESDIRLVGGAIRRDSDEWNAMYFRKRPSVERVFSLWKQRNVLESHSFRGLTRIRLLSQLYAIMQVAAKIAAMKIADELGVAA